MNLFYWLNPIVELIAFALSLFLITRKNGDWYRHFIIYLLIVVLTESSANTLYHVWGQKNHWVYNIYLPVQIGFVSWVAYKISMHLNTRNYILLMVITFMVMYCMEISIRGFLNYASNTKTIFSLFIICFCLTYFYQLLKDDPEKDNLNAGNIWVIAGLFIFYFGSTAANLFFDYLVELNKTQVRPIRYTIFLILNLLLYGSWTYGFICRQRQTIFKE